MICRKGLMASLLTCFILSSCPSWAAKICVDPGHGGTDSGYNGEAKNYILAIGLKVRDWLNNDSSNTAGGGSWTVVMTRTSDIYVSAQSRVDVANANACNRFMSVHMVYTEVCPWSITRTFCYTSASSYAFDLRNRVQSRMKWAWNHTEGGTGTSEMYELKYTAMPAECCEVGNSCPADLDCSTPSRQDEAGRAHLYALQEHYGIAAFYPGTLPTFIVDNVNAGFTASSNWATGTSSTDKYGSSYRWRQAAAISDTANWNAAITCPGNYKISAWWSQGTNRSNSALFILPNNANIYVNQQANGGRWNLLGTVYLATASQRTRLSCWVPTGYVVIADAIKYGP